MPRHEPGRPDGKLMYPGRKVEYRYPTSLKFAMDSDWLKSGEPLEKVSGLLEVLTRSRRSVASAFLIG